MPKAVAILLVVEMALAAIALFVLLDGVEWVREHIRAIGLSTVLLAGSIGNALAISGALAEKPAMAWAFIGLMSAACAGAVFIIARDFWKRHSHRTMRTRYLSHLTEDEWLVFDGQVERGPFSTTELIERYANGEIAPSHHVWKPGMDRWRPVYAAGLHMLAVQRKAIPLTNSRNHPEPRGNGCPSSKGVVPPWMAQSWTRYHPDRTRSMGPERDRV